VADFNIIWCNVNNSLYSRILFGLFILLMGFLLVNTQVVAEIYKWVDKNGDVHYGQIPPNENAQPIEAVPSNQSQAIDPKYQGSAGRLNRQAEELEKDQKKAEEQKKKVAEEEKRKAIKKENCQRAQTSYNTINEGGRMYQVDPDGERHYWSDSERATKLATAKDAIDEWCSDSE